jgi:hypothetical protein
MSIWLRYIGIASLISMCAVNVHAQVQDTLSVGMADTLRSEIRSPVTPVQIKPSVNFRSRDSLRIQLRGGRIARLFGAAKVEHTEGNLESGIITLDLDKSEMEAVALTPGDTLSQPVLKRSNEEVRSVSIRFNYKTGKGRFEVAKVSIDQGQVTGGQVKNVSPHVIFIEDAIYSTCDLDHPHFYVRAARMKVVDQEEVFFTKARLYLLDIPYPIVFPYGYFPGSFGQKKSGLLPVVYSFQQQQERGLGLQNLGWFQYFSDYFTGSFAIDAFTSGTFYGRSQLRYAKSNAINGTINLGYSVDQGMESTDPDFSKRRQNRFNMQHNQRFSPYASVTADITLQTSEFLRRNSLNIDDRAEVSTNSFVSYRYNHPAQRYTFNADIRQSQNFLNNTTDITGPSASFSLRTLTPFQRRNAPTSQRKWYESFTVNYNSRFQSSYRFRPTAGDTATINWFDALFDPTLYRIATGDDRHIDFGLRQEATTSVQLAGGEAVQLTANANILQVLVPYTVQRIINPDVGTTRNQSNRDLSLFHDGSAGLNVSSRFYGISNQRMGNITSFRHTLSPSLSFSFRPDFGSDFWGYYTRPIDERTGLPYLQTNPISGAIIDNRYSIFERNVFGTTPGVGMSRLLTLSVANVFEAKQVKRDSTGEQSERVLRLVDNLNVSTSYNMAADQFKLSPLMASFSSSLIQRLNINANAMFDYYGTDDQGNRVNDLLWNQSKKPFRMTSFSINSGTQFSRGILGRTQAMGQPYYPRRYDPFDQRFFSPFDPLFNRIPVSNLDVPWSVSLNFSYSWNRLGNDEIIRNAILQASNIQVRLTQNWNLSTRLGYDFIQQQLTPAEFNLSRNLHCWDLNFQWNPFGNFKYYYFTLKVNSGQFQGIFQKLPGLNALDQGSDRVRNSRNNNNYF